MTRTERKTATRAAKLIRDAEIGFVEFMSSKNAERLIEVLKMQIGTELMKSVEGFVHGAYVSGFGHGFDAGAAQKKK